VASHFMIPKMPNLISNTFPSPYSLTTEGIPYVPAAHAPNFPSN
jgi:hypothetical protein